MDLKFEFSHLTMAYLAEYRAAVDAAAESPTAENQQLLACAARSLAANFALDATENGV